MEPGGDVPLSWYFQKEMGAEGGLTLLPTGCSHGTGAGGDPAHLIPLPHRHRSQREMEVPSGDTNTGFSVSGITLSLEAFMLYGPSQGPQSAVTVVGPESLLNFL